MSIKEILSKEGLEFYGFIVSELPSFWFKNPLNGKSLFNTQERLLKAILAPKGWLFLDRNKKVFFESQERDLKKALGFIL